MALARQISQNSRAASKNTKFILEKVRLLHDFNAISDGNNITRSKPDPEVFLKATQFLGIEPSECVVVEDAYAGIDAAGYEKADYSCLGK